MNKSLASCVSCPISITIIPILQTKVSLNSPIISRRLTFKGSENSDGKDNAEKDKETDAKVWGYSA